MCGKGTKFCTQKGHFSDGNLVVGDSGKFGLHRLPSCARTWSNQIFVEILEKDIPCPEQFAVSHICISAPRFFIAPNRSSHLLLIGYVYHCAICIVRIHINRLYSRALAETYETHCHNFQWTSAPQVHRFSVHSLHSSRPASGIRTHTSSVEYLVVSERSAPPKPDSLPIRTKTFGCFSTPSGILPSWLPLVHCWTQTT